MPDNTKALLEDFPASISLPVEWGQMDAFGHVNNIVYFRYFESARIAYFEKTGILAHMQSHDVGPILGHTQCRYRLPLTYPDTVTVGARVIDLGDDRFEMAYRVVSQRAASVAAEGTATVVYLNYKTASKIEVPRVIRDAIEQLEASRS